MRRYEKRRHSFIVEFIISAFVVTEYMYMTTPNIAVKATPTVQIH